MKSLKETTRHKRENRMRLVTFFQSSHQAGHEDVLCVEDTHVVTNLSY